MLDFSNLNDSYFAVLMKESPKLFKDNRAFLHRKLSATNTGIELPGLAHVVYIELDKCLRLWLSGNCPAEYADLALWLCAIADINNVRVREAIHSNKTLNEMADELERMGKDRKELKDMLFDKYEESVRYSGLQQARREGIEEGIEKGIEKGRKDGELLKLFVQIKKKLEKGKAPSAIAEELEEEPETVEELCRLIKENQEEKAEVILERWKKI